MQLCVYSHINNLIKCAKTLSVTLQMSHILSEKRVTKSVSDQRGVRPDCKMCVRDTKCYWDLENIEQ